MSQDEDNRSMCDLCNDGQEWVSGCDNCQNVRVCNDCYKVCVGCNLKYCVGCIFGHSGEYKCIVCNGYICDDCMDNLNTDKPICENCDDLS